MAQALDQARLEQLDFRRALPVGFLSRSPRELAGQLSVLLGKFAEVGGGTGAVSSLAELLFSRTPSPIDSHFSVLDNLADLNPATLLRKRTGTLCYFYEEGEQVVLRFSGGTVSMPKRIQKSLEFILRSDWFTVASIPGLDAAGQLVLARRLIREGLLTIVD